MSTDSEDEVIALKSSHLGQAQASLYGDEQKGVIASAGPGTLVRCGEQRIDFLARQELH
ncbi:hypothetical protein D3C87_1881010 [compost metagenome]